MVYGSQVLPDVVPNPLHGIGVWTVQVIKVLIFVLQFIPGFLALLRPAGDQNVFLSSWKEVIQRDKCEKSYFIYHIVIFPLSVYPELTSC